MSKVRVQAVGMEAPQVAERVARSLTAEDRSDARPYTFATMRRVTDYALARRAVLRDFRRGALTRLEVCDAHPELMRAAQRIGSDLEDECPVCGATNLRVVSYVYGDKLKQANGRAITNEAELRKLGASCDEFACYDVEVCVECRWNHLRRQSLHGRLHAS
jgi:Family of unknown function (DUF5318)